MPRQIGKLTHQSVSRAKKRGYIADGGGLYLQVNPSGETSWSRSWVFRYRDSGTLREMGLGSAHTLTLAEARDAAAMCRKQRLAGVDPIAARKAARTAALLESARAMTFRQCAEAFIEGRKSGWRNVKHQWQWPASLERFAYPVLGDLSVQDIDAALVEKALRPIWSLKTETAARVRGRIESVLDWARVRGYRTGENPARWKGNLDQLLPAPGKVAKVQHYASLPYRELSSFIADLRQQPGVAARALEFAILTAARTGEVVGAAWNEIDLIGAVWTVPAERMKAGREHRVPLSPATLAVLRTLQAAQQGKFVFPGGKPGRPLSNMAMLSVLRRMKRGDLTAHGFRSTFRDWVAERTNYPREVAEHALAHSLPDKVEAAYQRSDLFDKRRRLMDDWSAFCVRPIAPGGEVVPMRRSS